MATNPPFQNIYHRRAVAPSASKPCYICYKPTPCVLNQASSKDFFYICPGHLSDTGFCKAVVDEAAEKEKAEKARREELEGEIERVKKEFAAKAEKRKKKEGEKSNVGGKKKVKDDDEPAAEDPANPDISAEEVKAEEEEQEQKLKELEAMKDGAGGGSTVEGPRVFELHKSVFQMRVQRIRKAQQVKQTAERQRQPGYWPSVPSAPL